MTDDFKQEIEDSLDSLKQSGITDTNELALALAEIYPEIDTDQIFDLIEVNQ